MERVHFTFRTIGPAAQFWLIKSASQCVLRRYQETHVNEGLGIKFIIVIVGLVSFAAISLIVTQRSSQLSEVI